MSDVEICGASDDIVVVRHLGGHPNLTNEFDALQGCRLEFDDGTAIDARFDHEGIWRLTVSLRGTARAVTKEEVGIHLQFDEDNCYSDRIQLFGVGAVRAVGSVS